MVTRKIYKLKKGDVIDVKEYISGRYGAPGKKREKRNKPTPEQVRVNNAMRKAELCRMRMLEYFDYGDIWATWTYEVENRPVSMEVALNDFQAGMRIVRREFKKRGCELFWIRNIEHGTKGAWHIHLIINEIGDTVNILKKAWKKGGVWFTEIRYSKFYDEDFTKLANYMTKDEYTQEVKKDGTKSRPRLKDASYRTSKNMPLPAPKVDKLVRWKAEPKPKKGYYIAKIYEANNYLEMPYRRYTMIRINRRI